MENNERDRKLDQWLDEALSNYSAADPRFGLEQRVLNRIRNEEPRSRKWNFWRWMPALGAIAALIVVAVAVRPMLEKKTDTQPLKSKIDTYSLPTDETQKRGGTESVPKSVAAPTTKSTTKPDMNDAFRGSPIRRELALVPQKKDVPSPADRDKSVTAQALASPVQVQPLMTSGVAGVVAGGVPSVAATATPPSAEQPDQNAITAEVRADQPVLLNDNVPTQSVTSVTGKDSHRKEAHTKTETTLQDANTMEFFGVTVRFQTGPTIPTQQFPTPVPLSNQEKLALKAGAALKDIAVAQHKSAVISPIEIKDVEIKPLEGAEQEKEK